MVFSGLFFVYVFLPLNLLFYHFSKDIEKKNIVMLTFSLVFYSWNGPKYLFLLLFMALVSYIGAILIENSYHKKKRYLVLTIAISLLILGYFKYLGFFAGIAQTFVKAVPIPNIILPIGISFYTFQLISYVVDVYRGEVEAQKSYLLLLLYVSMFHQCIAGPIVRYSDIRHDILYRKKDYDEIREGVRRFCYGLAKKAILANGIAVVADSLLLTNDVTALKAVPVAGLWLGALAFTFQIYFDFSAYSDMAIGMGLMTGFHYKENFNLPYTSASVTEFWRRWHISLSSFFRDYVYIPLGGNRSGNVLINLFVVWFLTGMWHGASFNYIFWGLYYFIFIVIERLFLNKILKNTPKLFGVMYTFLVVVIGWVLFKFEDLNALYIAFKGLFGLNGNELFSAQTGILIKNNIFLIIICIFAASSLPSKIRAFFDSSRNFVLKDFLIPLYSNLFPWVLLLVSSLALIGNSYNPFLYFQF